MDTQNEDLSKYLYRVTGMGTTAISLALNAKPRALQTQWQAGSTQRAALKERVAGYLALRGLDLD